MDEGLKSPGANAGEAPLGPAVTVDEISVTGVGSIESGESLGAMSGPVNPSSGKGRKGGEKISKNTKTQIMTEIKDQGTFLGIDLGTNTTVVVGSVGRDPSIVLDFSLPTLVGEVTKDTVLGVFDDGTKILIGADAARESDYLNIRRPLRDGVIHDVEAVGIFFKEIQKRVMKENPENAVYAVIGIPARTSEEDRNALANACRGIFDRFILAPEPFLAALGHREDDKLKSPDYHDPVRNSLIIDIGAGTTDICVVQGKFPTDKDTFSLPVAGDWIDEQVLSALKGVYAQFDLTVDDIRKIKEENAAVDRSAIGPVEVVIKGKKRVIDVAAPLSGAVQQLLGKIFDSVVHLIENSPSRMSEVLVKNIFLTGGGSQVRSLDKALQDKLTKYGFEAPVCRSVGKEYLKMVASGAWKLSRTASRDFWQSNI